MCKALYYVAQIVIFVTITITFINQGIVKFEEHDWFEDLNETLQNAVASRCNITFIEKTDCQYSDLGTVTHVRYDAKARVDDACGYETPIPWYQYSEPDTTCYKINTHVLPSTTRMVDCRVDCDGMLWYTNDFDSENREHVGILLILASTLPTLFCYCYHHKKINKCCAKCCKGPNPWQTKWTDLQETIQVEETIWSHEQLLAKKALQGDWQNDDGLLISVDDTMVTFFPSRNSYRFQPCGTSSLQMRIDDRNWMYVSSKETSDSTVAWVYQQDKISWVRRIAPPPTYNTVGGRPPNQVQPSAPLSLNREQVSEQPPSYDQAVVGNTMV